MIVEDNILSIVCIKEGWKQRTLNFNCNKQFLPILISLTRKHFLFEKATGIQKSIPNRQMAQEGNVAVNEK